MWRDRSSDGLSLLSYNQREKGILIVVFTFLMLPPGHIAGGYLVAETLFSVTNFSLSSQQTNVLLLLGMFFAFAPDLDFFYAFFRLNGWTLQKNTVDHRKFISHTPIVWLIAGLSIFFAAQSSFMKVFGLLVWLGAWSHFVLDTIEYGIMWLWPFSTKVFALANQEKKFVTQEKRFVRYWTRFVWWYMHRMSFWLELGVILVAVFVFFMRRLF